MNTACAHQDNAGLQSGIDAKTRLLRGLADASRLAILETLRSGEQSVGELVRATGLAQSNVSNHLACLLGCGLVEREQRGRHVFYRLGGTRVEKLLGAADDLLGGLADATATCPHCGGRKVA
ncbi:MAG: metalloregulator ArsR/SmtB family transcription factor [Gemmatimonadota bacterium]